MRKRRRKAKTDESGGSETAGDSSFQVLLPQKSRNPRPSPRIGRGARIFLNVLLPIENWITAAGRHFPRIVIVIAEFPAESADSVADYGAGVSRLLFQLSVRFAGAMITCISGIEFRGTWSGHGVSIHGIWECNPDRHS